jgi:4-hydroxy-2-oxoheptanedioate aldolase
MAPLPTPNRLKAQLAAGEPTLGVIVTVPSVAVVQTLVSAGVDWLILDMEHASIGPETLQAMIAATSGTAVTPLVRLPWAHAWQSKLPLDLGAKGIVFPMICSQEQAVSAAGSVKYPPEGNRLWGPFYAPMSWAMPMPDYIASANANVLAIATIEDAAAIRNIDSIVSTPGIDLAFIGPGDLAMSMGIPGQFEHPQFLEAVKTAEKAILRSSVALGGVARTPEHARSMIRRGYKALVFGFDWMLLQRSALSFIDEVRETLTM